MTKKYQPRHAAPKKTRGNEYTKDVWICSFFLAALTYAFLARYNGATGVVTLNWWTSIARMFIYIGVFTFIYALIAAAIYISYINRIERHNARALAEIRKNRK